MALCILKWTCRSLISDPECQNLRIQGQLGHDGAAGRWNFRCCACDLFGLLERKRERVCVCVCVCVVGWMRMG